MNFPNPWSVSWPCQNDGLEKARSLARSRTAVTAFRGEIRKKRWREEGGRESHGEAT